MTLTSEQVTALIGIIVAALFAAFATGGATVAAVLIIVFRAMLGSPVVLSLLQKLYEGLSPEWKQAIQLADQVVDKVDGQPNMPLLKVKGQIDSVSVVDGPSPNG